MVRCNFGAVGCSDSKVLLGSTSIMKAGTTASLAGTTEVCADFPTDNSAAANGNQAAMIPAKRGCNNQSFYGEQSNKTITVGYFPCSSTTAVTECPRARTIVQHCIIGSAHHDFCNILSRVDSESFGESDKNSVSDLSDTKYECESDTEDCYAHCLQHDISVPAIDSPTSWEGATVSELAVPSAEEFADAYLQELDLINLLK